MVDSTTSDGQFIDENTWSFDSFYRICFGDGGLVSTTKDDKSPGSDKAPKRRKNKRKNRSHGRGRSRTRRINVNATYEQTSTRGNSETSRGSSRSSNITDLVFLAGEKPSVNPANRIRILLTKNRMKKLWRSRIFGRKANRARKAE